MLIDPRAPMGRRPKAAKERSRGKYGTRQGSECYGDCMLAAIAMVDAASARGDVHLSVQGSPGECNRHWRARGVYQRAIGGLMEGMGSRGEPHRRMLPQLLRVGMKVVQEGV